MFHPFRRNSCIATCLLWLSIWSGAFSADGYLYRLHLTDKAGSTYCNLSERAMQRRERQSIPLDDADLDISPAYLTEITAQGWQIVTRSRWLNTVVVQRPDSSAIADAEFAALSFIGRVETIGKPVELTAAASAMRGLDDGALANDKWRLSEQVTSATAGDNFRQPMLEVRGDALCEAGLRGAGMLITVIDGGFLNLPRWTFLSDKVVGWYDCYAARDASGDGLFNDDSGHGTMVLSCMATDSIYGVWGSAPEASYFLIQSEFGATETPLEEDMWVQAAEMADSIGTDVINSSLGYTKYDNAEFNHSWDDLGQEVTQVSRGAAIATQKGILVCCSAGNERDRAWKKISCPADVADVFTVGGTDASLSLSSFSSVGWTVPNVKPDVVCRGTKAWIINATTGKAGTSNGTSFASPLMCGLMASLWGANPSLTPAELRQIVRESASQSASPDSLMGYGLPDFAKALAVINPELSIGGVVADGVAITDRETLATKPRNFDLLGRPMRAEVTSGWQVVNGRAVLRVNGR